MRRSLPPLLSLLLAVLLSVDPICGRSLTAARPTRTAAAASGLGVNLSLVGRLVGAGNTLYASAVDVHNNAPTDVQVDFYLNGVNARTGGAVATAGSISATGELVSQGAGSMRGRSNAHYEDLIDSLILRGFLSESLRSDGFLGSMLVVFNGHSKKGQGGATVRFYNSLSGGTVGQSLKGREIGISEPQKLVALARDTRGQPGTKLYTNVFVNNLGFTPGGIGASGPVTVRFQAYANSSGQPTGITLDRTIDVGQTVGVSDVIHALQVPASEDTVLVYASVVSGTSAIAGVFVQIDDVTKDGSTTDMSPANF
ncbi:MAG TPA: hypothetical protein VGH97_07365 [Thermoanaerobaculia bacterium]|jgi:hypothetical protein